MNFKNYELRPLLPDNDLSYEIENVGVRPFEACEKTKGFAGWLQKIVDILNYINIFEDDDFEE